GWETIDLRVVGGAGNGSNKLEFVGAQSNAAGSTFGAGLDNVHFVKLADPGASLPDNAPVAQDGSAEGAHDHVITGQLQASDADNDAPLIFTLEDNAAHGAVTVKADGTFTYTPVAGFSGNDAFTFKVDDGHGGTDIATESLTIDPTIAVGTDLI